jgi:hypothetical protein
MTNGDEWAGSNTLGDVSPNAIKAPKGSIGALRVAFMVVLSTPRAARHVSAPSTPFGMHHYMGKSPPNADDSNQRMTVSP